MLTPGQVTDLTGIPSSSLRRYAKEFSEFLSNHAQGRRRLYTDRDVSVIMQIRELTNQGVPLEAIPEHLDRVYDIDQPEGEETGALALPGLVQKLEEMRASWGAAFEQQQRDINELRQAVEDLKRERNKPWYKRIFK